MPWIVGIDEAGYGPNLGPLVMTSVACRIPDELAGTNLWKILRKAVRREGEQPDGRILVEDSKVVYSPARGLGELETSVLAVLGPACCDDAMSLSRYLEFLGPSSCPQVREEPWYNGLTRLPVMVDIESLEAAAEQFHSVSTARQILWGPIRSVIVCPRRFNQLLDEWGSKGAILACALTELLTACWDIGDLCESIDFVVDKHGGRNTYAAMLQNALGDGMIMAQEECMRRSRYSALGLRRPMSFTFQPRADAEHFCVALASMVSKHLREMLMLEFNAFWKAAIPGLKSTAGYPGDAARFFKQIRTTVSRLGLRKTALWRRK